jgi:hypothetical protein
MKLPKINVHAHLGFRPICGEPPTDHTYTSDDLRRVTCLECLSRLRVEPVFNSDRDVRDASKGGSAT